MTRIVYINGSYKKYSEALISIEDRGYQFSDGVYEVISLINSVLIDEEWHLNRLEYSLKEIGINSLYLSWNSLPIIFRECIKRNRVVNGFIYIQITRGTSERNFSFNEELLNPNIIIFARNFNYKNFLESKTNGAEAMTTLETRWKNTNIKSISLLANVLAKQEAYKNGFFEAIFISKENYILEGSSSNIWIVNNNIIQTYPINIKESRILSGITRKRLLYIFRELGIKFLEKPYTREELYKSEEVFLSASISCILPIIRVDTFTINNGLVGPIVKKIQILYNEYIKSCINKYK